MIHLNTLNTNKSELLKNLLGKININVNPNLASLDTKIENTNIENTNIDSTEKNNNIDNISIDKTILLKNNIKNIINKKLKKKINTNSNIYFASSKMYNSPKASDLPYPDFSDSDSD